MNIQVTLGTINYTNYVHVTVAKVSNPTVVVWEQWFNTPVPNLNFVITGLDADDYYITYYDAPTNTSLGTDPIQCFASALSSEYEYEIRFYTGGSLPLTASLNSAGDSLDDTYLTGKEIHSVEKQGFGTLEPVSEYTIGSGSISLLTTTIATGEKLVVTIKNRVGNSSTAGGLYTGTLTVPEVTKTLDIADKNKLIRLTCPTAKQAITLPSLASLSIDDGFYFDNTCGGSAIQPKILTNGLERIRFNGFNSGSIEFAEFWCSRGEHLMIKKFDDDFWEVRLEYKGTNVGESFWANYLSHPNTLPGNGRYGVEAYDGDEYGRVYWWLKNVLPSNAKISDSGINSLSYVHPANAVGKWVIHPTLKLFRPPNTQGLTMKGLTSYAAYGSDSTRPVDAPGGVQPQKLMPHKHEGTTGTLPITLYGRGPVQKVVGTYNPEGLHFADLTSGAIDNSGVSVESAKMSVENVGRIELYRI